MIGGLSWQRWEDGLVIEERYFDGDQMQVLLDQGVLPTHPYFYDE